MAFPAHRILFFPIYSPWKHRIRKAFQIRLVSYILILILLSPPPWVDGRPAGSSQHFTDSNTVQNTHINTEQNTNGLSRFILDMYEVLNGNNRERIASNNTFNSRFLGQEQMKLVHSADIVRSFYNRYPSELTELEDGLSMNFDISTIHRREMLRFTEVRVWKSDITNSTLISLLSNKTISRQCLALNLMATKTTGQNPSRERSFVIGRLRLKPRDLERREYLSIHGSKLTHELTKWPRGQNVKLTLVISPNCRNHVDLCDLGISSVSDADHLLLMYTKMEGNDGFNDISIEGIGPHLRKRAARHTVVAGTRPPWLSLTPTTSPPVTNCHRHSSIIDITEDLGWSEWVVYPQSFDAFYCYGQCHYPIPSNYNSTNHALIQALIHMNDPSRVPPACCVPTEFQDLSFLYRQNSSYVLKKYKNMIALSCGCR